jgi:hypothetical protein
MRPKTINLHIEELVLNGFAPHERFAIADAVQSELTRLLAAQAAQGVTAAIAGSVELARLDAGSVQLNAGVKAAGVGAGIARALHGGITK